MLKPDMTSGVFRIWQRGGHGERVKRESITEVWAEPPAGSRGRAPGRGVKGEKPPWSWNTFCFWMFKGNHKFAHFGPKTHLFI